MKKNEFRAELLKILPGYKWVIRRGTTNKMFAIGSLLSGFNRMSTLSVIRQEEYDKVEYTAASAGSGMRAPWLAEHTDGTLARALRGLQDHCESMAAEYKKHAACIQNARKK